MTKGKTGSRVVKETALFYYFILKKTMTGNKYNTGDCP